MGNQKKPRGKLGYLEFSVPGPPEFHAVVLPGNKAEIESHVLASLLSAAQRRGDRLFSLVADPIRNPEDDYDFTLPTRQGKQYLDLMEIVVLPQGARGGHEQGRVTYDRDAMAEAVCALVLKKSLRYGRPRTPIHLLLYPTDWRFRLVPEVGEVLACFLGTRDHCFRSVTYFSPDEEEIFVVFPVKSRELVKMAKRRLKPSLIMLADLSRFSTAGPTSADIPLGPLMPEPQE